MSETVKNLQKTISLLNTEAKPEVLQDLKQLFEDANKDDLTSFVKECDVSPVIRLLTEEASVAEEVRKALIKIATVDTTHTLLCDSNLLATFDSVLKCGAVIRCRVYETVVQIANISEQHFQLVLKAGFLQQLFKDAEDFSDVLQAVNCVEILSYLTDTEYGRRYLETEVLSTFQTKIVGGLDTPSMEFNLIAPQVFKLFGVFGRYNPKVIFETYKDVVNSLLRIILMDNSDLIYGAIETVGFLGRTVD
ncbi:26S proteasome non-ATPase regulatory subunit 5-like protein, partial [Leptotrombidium deliense]